MKFKPLIIVATLSAIAVVVAVGTPGTVQSREPAARAATGAGAGPAHVGKRLHRWVRGRQNVGRICGHRNEAWIKNTLAVVEGLVDFTPVQAKAWNKLSNALRVGSTDMRNACNGLKKAGRPKTAPKKLARMETMLATRLSVVQGIRPAFEEFYGTLTAKQRKAVDRLISRHRRR